MRRRCLGVVVLLTAIVGCAGERQAETARTPPPAAVNSAEPAPLPSRA